jgi:hypothetical protein
MAHDFGLLLNAVTLKRPARLQAVIIAAEGMAREGQVDALLMLPHMGHFVDEQTLIGQMLITEIVAILIAFGMKMDVPARCHDDAARLEPPPFAVEEPYIVIVDRRAKHRFRKRAFGLRQEPSAQCAWPSPLPALRTLAGASNVAPLEKVNVRVIELANAAFGSISTPASKLTMDIIPSLVTVSCISARPTLGLVTVIKRSDLAPPFTVKYAALGPPETAGRRMDASLTVSFAGSLHADRINNVEKTRI